MLGKLNGLVFVCQIFQNILSVNSFKNTIRVSNRLDPDQSWSGSKLFENVSGIWEMTTVTASKQKLCILKDFRNAPPAKMLINCQKNLL